MPLLGSSFKMSFCIFPCRCLSASEISILKLMKNPNGIGCFFRSKGNPDAVKSQNIHPVFLCQQSIWQTVVNDIITGCRIFCISGFPRITIAFHRKFLLVTVFQIKNLFSVRTSIKIFADTLRSKGRRPYTIISLFRLSLWRSSPSFNSRGTVFRRMSSRSQKATDSLFQVYRE